MGLYDAVIAEAKARGVRVVGHLSERVGLLYSMQQKQASIEHTDEIVHALFNDRLDEKRIPVAVDSIVRGGAVVTPTLISLDAIDRQLSAFAVAAAAPDNAVQSPLVRAFWAEPNNPYPVKYGEPQRAFIRDSLAFQKKLVGALHDAHVPILAGTDAGWVPFVPIGASLHREMALLADAGLGAQGALDAATRAPAAFYGTNAGTVAVDRRADLVLLDGDPRDATSWSTPEGVMVSGRYYDRSHLEGMTAERATREAGGAEVTAAFARGDLVTAAALAGPAIRAHEIDEDQARWFALSLYRLDHLSDCVAVLGATAAAYPDSWAVHRTYGRALLALGHVTDARAQFQAALDHAPAAAIAAIDQDLHAAG